MADYDLGDVRKWAKGEPADGETEAKGADDAVDGDAEGAEPETIAEVVTGLQSVLTEAGEMLAKLDVKDEPAGVTSKAKAFLADLRDLQQASDELLTAYEEAHADDDDEPQTLDDADKKKAGGKDKGGDEKKAGKKKPPFGGKAKGGDDADAED